MQELEKILEEIGDIYVDDIAGWGVECNLKERANLPCDNCYECIKEVCKNIIRKHMKKGSKKGMGYKNPVPSIDDVMLCKKFYISKTFTFDENVTLEEAAEGIGRLIQENEGEIPAGWIGFADRPKVREECGWWNE